MTVSGTANPLGLRATLVLKSCDAPPMIEWFEHDVPQQPLTKRCSPRLEQDQQRKRHLFIGMHTINCSRVGPAGFGTGFGGVGGDTGSTARGGAANGGANSSSKGLGGAGTNIASLGFCSRASGGARDFGIGRGLNSVKSNGCVTAGRVDSSASFYSR